jgi:DNA-binding HxlR family transcriptional regulator
MTGGTVLPAPVDDLEMAIALLCRRWVVQIVARLLDGPHRFSDLLQSLRPLSANVLSRRLEELIEEGIVRRRAMSPAIKAQVYELTDDGLRLEPVVAAMVAWARTRTPASPG